MQILAVLNDINVGANFFTNVILEILLGWIWIIFIQGPLVIIDILMQPGGIFSYLTMSGLTDLLFGGQVDPVTFEPEHLPKYFVIFFVIATVTIVIMFIMQLIIIQFTETHTIREKLMKAIKNTFLSIMVIFFIPFFFTLINFLMVGLMSVLNLETFGKEGSLAKTLWQIGNLSGGYPVPTSYGPPPFGALTEWNYLVEFIAVWFTLYTLFLSSMTLVERIIDLLLLFSIAPIVAAMMPVDQGKRLGVWKEMTIGKFIIGPGTMLPIYIFIELLPKVMQDAAVHFNGDPWGRNLLLALFCSAGAISCLKTQKIINHLVTQNLGVQGAIDSNPSGMLGSIVGKAASFASLVGGGVDAAKFGKKALFGSEGKPDGQGGTTGGSRGLFSHIGQTGASVMRNVSGFTGRKVGAYEKGGGWGLGKSLGMSAVKGGLNVSGLSTAWSLARSAKDWTVDGLRSVGVADTFRDNRKNENDE